MNFRSTELFWKPDELARLIHKRYAGVKSKSIRLNEHKKQDKDLYRFCQLCNRIGGLSVWSVTKACLLHPVLCAKVGANAWSVWRILSDDGLPKGKPSKGTLTRIIDLLLLLIDWVFNDTENVRDLLKKLELESLWLSCLGLDRSSLESDEDFKAKVLHILNLLGITEADVQDPPGLRTKFQERITALQKLAIYQQKGETKNVARYGAQLLNQFKVDVPGLQSLAKECVIWNPTRVMGYTEMPAGTPNADDIGKLLTQWY